MGGIVAALAVALAQDVPDGEQRGCTTYIACFADYLWFAGAAQDSGYGDFGGATLTADIISPVNGTDPSPHAAVAQAQTVAERATEALELKGTFYRVRQPALRAAIGLHAAISPLAGNLFPWRQFK